MQQQQDVLTCGACQKAFALGDIVKFIQHKVLACNKENYAVCDPSSSPPHLESGDSDDGSVGVVNARRPSISAPIKKASITSTGREGRLCTPSASPEADQDQDPRCSTPKRPSSGGRPPLNCPPLNLASGETTDDDETTKTNNSTPPSSTEEGTPRKKLRTELSDAQSNTTNSEPNNYVCSTCKARLHSAWRLVQHVQNTHGVKIYVEPTATSSTTSPTTSSPSTSTSRLDKNQSGSSTSSTNSLPTGVGVPPVSLSSGPSSRLPIPPSIEPPIPLHNPFTVGGILRLPMEPRPHQYPPPPPPTTTSFMRPSSHDFRMDHLVSEQFRLSQQHSLNLAATLAAASGVPTFPPPDRPSLAPRTPVAQPPPPTLGGLNLEPQLDFYSQRLRQLAGTTSPPTTTGASGASSPIVGARNMTTTSPNNSSNLQPSANPNTAVINNNNNNNSTNNNNLETKSPSPKPQNLSPPPNPKNDNSPSERSDPLTPKLESPLKPTDFSMPHPVESMETDNKIHACDYCGKKFRFHSNLLVHRRCHTGEKPYKCTVCNHACSQSSKLKRHMRVHRRSRSMTMDDANPNGNTSNDQSNEGSIGTAEDDDDDEDMEDEDDEEEEEEDDDEEMELEDEEDEDDDVGGDAPEDLTTKSTSSTPPTGENKSSPQGKVQTGSLVGELMDKYGLSNIQQYSEAYKQALQESVGAHHILRKEDLIHRSHLLTDNNNCKPPHRLENGLLEKSAALRFREEFAKNLMSGQPPMDLVAGHSGLFGSPFENPFDTSKRLKMEREGIGRERDNLYPPSMWLPALAVHHREHSIFGGNGSETDILMKDKCKTGSPSTSASLAAAAAAALNLGLPSQNLKKESRRNDTCEYCGKVFKNCSNLTVHRRSHTGEKPYKCELCSYACAQSSKLTRHMKTHGRMGKDVYRCRFCEMPFSVPSTLEKHMRKCVVNQNIKVEHILPSMLSGDEDSATSMSKDAATT